MKIFTGKVASNSLNKTLAVTVSRVIMHPLYLKRYKRDRKYLVHDELGAKLGDTVKFIATRPYSKLVKWNVVEVVGKKSNAKPEVKKEVVEKDKGAKK